MIDIDSTFAKVIKRRQGSDHCKFAGEKYEKRDTDTFAINPQSRDDYRSLFTTLRKDRGVPGHILHLWSKDPFESDESLIKKQMGISFFSVFHLCRELLEQKIQGAIQILYF